MKSKKILYPKKQEKNSSYDSTKKNREFGIEISNMNKNKKEIRYPKPSNSKENVNNLKPISIKEIILKIGKNPKIKKKKGRRVNQINPKSIY